MAVTTALVLSAAATAYGAASNADNARKARHAVTDAQKIAGEVEYQPIDIAALTQSAHDQAVKNATDSLSLEASLQPDVSRTRSMLSKSVSDELSRGGTLPPDVINQVTNAARVTSGGSGTLGSAMPLTAQRIGVSALSLLNQRQNNAANLLSANPLPVAGLDPGTLASLEAQNNAAENQFNLAKAGVQTNLVNSQAQANAAQGGVNAANYASLLNLLTKNQSGSVDSGSILGKLASAYGSGSNPGTNPVDVPYSGWGMN